MDGENDRARRCDRLINRLSPARTFSGGAIENRGVDTRGLATVGDGICAKNGREYYMKQSDSNLSA